MIFLSPHQRDLSILPPKGNKARKLALLFLVLGPLFFGAVALFLGQDSNWDLRNYHWYNAYALLNGRHGFDLLPSQTPFFYNPALDVPYFLLATHVPPVVSGFILGAVQGLNFVLLFMLCHITLIVPQAKQKVFICATLAALGLLGAGALAQLGTSFYDNITSLGLFLSALLSIHFFDRMRAAPWGRALGLALLCGFPAGLMMGFKLPFVVFCFGLCGAFLFVTGPFVRRVWIAFGFGLGILLGLALSYGPWGIFLQDHYGSPMFPYFNNFFHAPLAPATDARDIKFLPTSWGEYLFYPFIFAQHPLRVGEIPWHDLRIPVLYALLPMCLLVRLAFGRNKNAPDKLTTFVASRYLLWTAALSYATWLCLFAIYRYLLPLEMLAPLLVVIVLGFLPTKPHLRAIITLFVLLVVAANIQAGDWGRIKPWKDKIVTLTPPEIKDPDHTMILMAGYEPYAHAVTVFPPSARFIRIQSNFVDPRSETRMAAMIYELVAAHQGPLNLLIPSEQLDWAHETLTLYNLSFKKESCQFIKDETAPIDLYLCDLYRLKQPPTPKDKHHE